MSPSKGGPIIFKNKLSYTTLLPWIQRVPKKSPDEMIQSTQNIYFYQNNCIYGNFFKKKVFFGDLQNFKRGLL
jgi:hypothetical protein